MFGSIGAVVMCDRFPLGVQAQDLGTSARQYLREMALRYQYGGAGVFQHESLALTRTKRVYRNVTATGFENPDQRDDHLHGPFHRNSDQQPRLHAE